MTPVLGVQPHPLFGSSLPVVPIHIKPCGEAVEHATLASHWNAMLTHLDVYPLCRISLLLFARLFDFVLTHCLSDR